jgi:crotonobetainyl-CoA:carnitine CoA-transferase CaiB-like acyl-CoA transferase
VRTGAPLYGEHTREVLHACGFDDQQIERFEKEGAIVTMAFHPARQQVA